MIKRIPVAGPLISHDDIEAVTDAVSNDWYENANHSTELFEKYFAKKVNRKYAIALPSCTSGIHLALLAGNITSKHSVIIPNLTWIASAAPIHYVNATALFVDVKKDTWCLCEDAIEEAIREDTKAIIAVNLYGGMPNWDKILTIAKKYNLFVIEDAAESIGSRYHDKPAGSFGDVSVFSLHASKTITTGEGGILVTDCEKIYQRILFLRDHGRVPGDTSFYNTEVAFKYKMSSMQAALGLSQVKKLNTFIDIKRKIFKWYQIGLQSIEDILLNIEPPNTFNTYWMVTMILGNSYTIDKKQLGDILQSHHIDTRPIFHPLSKIPAYKKILENKKAFAYPTPNTDTISPRGINLPSALILSKEQVDYTCQTLKNILSQFRG